MKNNIGSISLENGDWIIHVNPRPWDIRVEIWLLHKNGNITENAVIKNGLIELSEVKEGDIPEVPFLVVPMMVWQLIVDAMSKETPPTQKLQTEGKLEATQYHLEDLRKLLKI